MDDVWVYKSTLDEDLVSGILRNRAMWKKLERHGGDDVKPTYGNSLVCALFNVATFEMGCNNKTTDHLPARYRHTAVALTSTLGHVGVRAVQKQTYMSFGGVGFRHMPDGRNPEGGTIDAIVNVVTDAWNKQQTYFGSDHGSLFATCLESDGYCAGGVVTKS